MMASSAVFFSKFNNFPFRSLFVRSHNSIKTKYLTWALCHKSFARLSLQNEFSSIQSKQRLYARFLPYRYFEENNLTNICDFRFCSRWGKCASSNFLEKQKSRKCQKSRSIQSSENADKSQHRSTKLKETRKKVAKKMEEIKENVLTIPNGLCALRIAATPFLGYFVLEEFYVASLGIFIFAGFTDVVDGYIARTFPSQQSMIGSFLDPAADKLLVATLFLTLTFNGLIPVPLTSIIIFRDACLMTAGFYIRYVSLPPPKTLGRYFDMSFATARLSPTAISKANTLVQFSLVAFSLAAPVFGFVDHLCLQILWYITGATTVLSAGSYLYYRNTYKLLLKDKTKKIVRY